MRNITAAEAPFANASLFERHPGMASWPKSHDFHIVTLEIEELWLIDMFGGASHIAPDDYFKASPPSDTEMGLPMPVSSAPPPFVEKAKTARWMAHNLTYGVLSTTSVAYKGVAFGNPQSFVDGSADNSSGMLYFYVSDLDASMQDVAANPVASFTLTEEFSNGYCSGDRSTRKIRVVHGWFSRGV